MFEYLAEAVGDLVFWITQAAPDGTFFNSTVQIRALLATLLVSLTCGSVGSLVVGQRMAFFSDALAHCAFAGVAFGLLAGLFVGASGPEFQEWILTIMAGFGIAVGMLMVYVQERSGLPSDTVIGVFFAGAIGLGAVFVKTVGGRSYFQLENFLFGEPLFIKNGDIVLLVLVALLTWLVLAFTYNTVVFSSFNRSLSLSRGMRVRLQSYVFVALLALVVNVSLQIVGVLLVNGLLIVPAAAAANCARNMRQLFWGSVILCFLASWAGIALSWEIYVPDPLAPMQKLQFGIGGMIVVLCVMFFLVSLWLGPYFRNRRRGL